MSPIAIGLIIFSAMMHAGWNLMGKRHAPSLSFFTLSMSAGALAFTPFVFSLLWQLPAMPATFWWLLLGTGLAQAVYMAGLAWAYARADVSLIYPMARALPVVMVPCISWLLLDNRVLTAADWLGMMVIVVGSLILPLPRLSALHWRSYATPALGFMLLAALGTCGYSLIDSAALRVLRQHGLSAFEAGSLYLTLQAYSSVLWMLPVCLLGQQERPTLRGLLQRQQMKVWASTGIAILLTYWLILIAMSYVTDVSYVVALRQLSIPLGVLAGIVWLKETPTAPRLLGVTVIVIGLLLVALG
ncbi:drug/metabolite transporter [Pokkaliibacter sp. MBI-7]|uniref:drug/metabolite transporter n=1 Tax=Pokkaliibacter sp. MBI-7 TaxID=3040600 RepID=UPI002446E763|nr:drug/metabolite transporter [Pokkaliibacter sp. MBI-7]MDH2433190.1 drug/metabolite transporter [Pokkaliibacter sp. MBI-7]